MLEENQPGTPYIPANVFTYKNDPDIKRWKRTFSRNTSFLALCVVASLLIFYLLQIFAMPPLRNWVLDNAFLGITDQVFSQLFILLVYLCAFLMPYLVYAKIVHYQLRDIPHDAPYPPVLLSCTGIGMAASIIGVILAFISILFFSLFGLVPITSSEVPTEKLAYLLSWINTTFVAAFVEEFVFRGIIMGSLRRYNDLFALVVSSLLFSLMHRNMVQIPHTLVIGFMIGYFAMKTNSIWTGIVIHFFNNAVVMLLERIPDDTIRGLIQLLLYGIYILGAIGGIVYLLAARRFKIRLYPRDCPLKRGTIYGRFFRNISVLLMFALFVWVISLSFERGTPFWLLQLY